MSGRSAPVRLLIVDDHPIVRDGLRGAFTHSQEFEVVGEAGNGAEALDLVAELKPDLVLMDLRMPVMDGVTAIHRLSETAPEVRVLVLTTFDTDNDVLPAIEAGATSYLLKDAPTEELLRAARVAARGEAMLSPTITKRLMDRVRRPSLGMLSARELEVMRLVAHGSSNKEVAGRLFITEASVKTHLLRIYDKLGVRDRAGAVGEAFRRGLVT
ncbi:response regulator transcription factor [Streptomyces sp. RPA4-5]|uniref:response regulator n=1 Tax=Streptomyces sp. RPA4-5 TaxID=2721245 RepID=UPI00143ECD1A|nr:response regulator transcription factor [Streptomyces sp. RPA4-5]QIY59052.1 response regulator transcription factor [Streptomyces sp. RPA4-5]